MTATHWMRTEIIEDRATTRYTCPTCDRCLELGPDGLRILHRGDQSANHRAGALADLDHSVVQVDSAKPHLH